MNIKKMKLLLHRPGNAFLSSLFWSYFILSMTLLAINIPILTFTGRNTAKQNRLNNNYIVSNNQAYFDDALGDIKSLTMSLFFSDVPSQILNRQIISHANYYDTTELKKYVTDHSLQIPIPFSVSFYVPGYNLIVSPLGINPPEKYYINNYCGNGYEGWLERIKDGDEFSAYSYECDGITRRKLIYRYNSNSFPGNTSEPIIFFAEIDDDIFTAKMAEIQKQTSHLFVISDTDNNILLSNDKAVTESTKLEDIFPHGSYIYTEKKSSAAGNIKYTLISPNSVGASPEKQVRLLITVDLALCLLFAIGYSIFSMKKHGSPVVSLINEISSETSAGTDGEDAISFAKTKVDELKRIGEKTVQLSNRKYLQNILTGNTKGTSKASLIARFPSFSDRYFTLILIKPTQLSLTDSSPRRSCLPQQQ